jgi:hypothetical protein
VGGLVDTAMKNARDQIRKEARAAVLPYVALAVALSLYALTKGRR